MSRAGEYRPIEIIPGVQPSTDLTEVSTRHYTYTDKIRFENGKPKKIGGWESIDFEMSKTIDGYGRSIFSEFINEKHYAVIGTNTKLYSLIGTSLINITPLQTSSTTVANSLSTHYDTLGSNPLAAVDGSSVVTVTDANAADYVAGDTITLSGASAFAGLGTGDLNTDHIVRSVGSGVYTINVGTEATSSASGGGASVVRASGLVTVAATSHGQVDGDRVKIDSAATFGGITTGQINAEHIIRNSETNTFDVMTAGTATSSVSSAGGANTEYFEEIADGLQNEVAAQGYGAGLYGAGLYGTALISSTGRTYPRIWHADRYGDTVITTPGNQGGVYQWDGDTDTAPTLISNAPTAVNYIFESNNIIVTLGAGGNQDRIYSSDNTDITVWTSSSVNQVFDDDIEGAGKFISHAGLEDINLLFTEYKTFTMRYIGLPLIWDIEELDNTVGIIAPMARVSVNGVAYWMGGDNFYMYRGGDVEIIPANSQNECTALRYVFENLNYGQKSKIFAWFNKTFQEIWWHYPSAGSVEPDRVIRFHIYDRTWTIDTLDRTAGEYPSVKQKNPYLLNAGTLYKHELGYNDDGSAMAFTARSDKRYYGRDNKNVNAIIPDSIQAGDITFNVSGWLHPQSSTKTYDNDLTVSTTTEIAETINSARVYQYEWSGSVLDQNWHMGAWMEEIQGGAKE